MFLLKSPRHVISNLGTHHTELRQVRADFEVFEWSLTVLPARRGRREPRPLHGGERSPQRIGARAGPRRYAHTHPPACGGRLPPPGPHPQIYAFDFFLLFTQPLSQHQQRVSCRHTALASAELSYAHSCITYGKYGKARHGRAETPKKTLLSQKSISSEICVGLMRPPGSARPFPFIRTSSTQPPFRGR